MDIEQSVVFRLVETIEALDGILEKLPEDGKGLARSTTSFHRLVAYELMATPQILDYNHLFKTTNGLVYMEQRVTCAQTSSEKGFFVLRAPLLPLVTLLLDHYHSHSTTDWKDTIIRAIVLRFPQHQCCWYNVNKKKACACEARHLETQKDQCYVFCHKHWSPVLRGEKVEETALCPPSEMNLDDWLQTIV